MISLKSKVLVTIILLISAGITANQVYDRYFPDDESRFQWPEKVEIPCQPDSEDYGCENYIQLNSTPVKTVKHPMNEKFGLLNWMGKSHLGMARY